MAKKKTEAGETPAKKVCEINRKEFEAEAKGVAIDLAGVHIPRGTISVTAAPREFSSGSLGWYVNAPTELMLNGVAVKVQVQVTITVANSKDLPK
jgi:hypothetical protein